MRITYLALLSAINTYASAEDRDLQSVWSSPLKKKKRALNAWSDWSKPTKQPVSPWNGKWSWDGNQWNWSWGGGWGPKPTEKPTSWDNSWSGKGPSSWVVNGWGGDAWAGSGWVGNGWGPKEPVVTPTLSPSSGPSENPSENPSDDSSDEPSFKPSLEPSDEPSKSNVPTLEPSDEPSFKPSLEPSTSFKPSLEPSDEPTRSPAPSTCFEPDYWDFEYPNDQFPDPPAWTNGFCFNFSSSVCPSQQNCPIVGCNRSWTIDSTRNDTPGGTFSLKSPDMDSLGNGNTNTYRASAELNICSTSPSRQLRFRVFPGAVRPWDRLIVVDNGRIAWQVADANQVEEQWETVEFPLTAGVHVISFQYEYNPLNQNLASQPVSLFRDGSVWIDNVQLIDI